MFPPSHVIDDDDAMKLRQNFQVKKMSTAPDGKFLLSRLDDASYGPRDDVG